MRACTNCGAKLPDHKGGHCDGTFYCCIHCAFNPLGCRCKYGEFEIAESRPDFGIDEGELAEFEGDLL